MVLDFLQIVILVRKSTTLKKLPMQKDLRLISGICHMSRFPQCIGSLAPPRFAIDEEVLFYLSIYLFI